MKQIVYQLETQTYSTQSESSFLGHRCWEKAAIWCLPDLEHTRLGSSWGNPQVLPFSRIPECWADCTQSTANNWHQGTPLLHSLISRSGKAELSNSQRTMYLGNGIELLRADFNPLTKTLTFPSSFSQPTNTKAEFALLKGCNPSLALLLILGFPPSASLLFCLNIWIKFGAQTNHSDVCKQRQTYTIITTSKSCSNTWKKANKADVHFTLIWVF